MQASSLGEAAVALQGSGSTSGWQQSFLRLEDRHCLKGSDWNFRVARRCDPEEIRMPTPQGHIPSTTCWLPQGPASILEFSKPLRGLQPMGLRFHSWLGSLAMRALARVSPEIEAHCYQLSRGVSHAEQRPPGWLLLRLVWPRGFRKMSQVGQVRFD